MNKQCKGCMHKEFGWCHRYNLPAKDAVERCRH